jgi:hypothetical protein
MIKKVVFLSIFLFSSLSFAQEKNESVKSDENIASTEESGLKLKYNAEYRFWVNDMRNPLGSARGFLIDPDGTTWNEGSQGNQRMRLGFLSEYGKLSLKLEGDILAAAIFNSSTEKPQTSQYPENFRDKDAFLLREANVSLMTPLGLIKAGQMTSHFGLGLIANDGVERESDLFNLKTKGDLVWRFLFATKPLAVFSKEEKNSFADNFYLALGADAVFRDENARFFDGDRAYEFLGSIFYRKEETEIGTYGVYRTQKDNEKTNLKVYAFDVFARGEEEFNNGEILVHAAGEGAMIRGITTRMYPTTHPGTMDIFSFGFAGEIGMKMKKTFLDFTILSGLATGDANTDDDTIYRFRFDPDYRAGMILFDHYLPAMLSQAVKRAKNPEIMGYPPEGIDELSGVPGVENTLYLMPRFIFGEYQGFTAGLQVLFAWSAEKIADPYFSFRAGGEPHNYLGAKTTSYFLGEEFDLSFKYKVNLLKSKDNSLDFMIQADGGIFFPGSAFRKENGKNSDAVSLARARISVVF